MTGSAAPLDDTVAAFLDLAVTDRCGASIK
jgi:hypothetical protein